MESPISFIIPFWGTDPYRLQSLGYLHALLAKEFKDWEKPPMGYGLRNGDPIERSAARNALARRAIELQDSQILVFLDADTIPDPNALVESIGHVGVSKRWMHPYRTYYNLTEEGSEEFKKDPPYQTWRPEDSYEHEYVFPGEDATVRPPAVGGCVIVHRTAFEKVGGYDERFKGWGGEDRAFIYSLETLVGDAPRYPAAIYHLWHPAPEDKRFGQPGWDANHHLLERYEKAISSQALMSALVKSR